MKKLFTVFALSMITVLSLQAQPPMGGGGMGGGRGGFGGGGGRMGGGPPGGGQFNPRDIEETVLIDSFPAIPDLTSKQKEAVEKVMIDEQKAIRKLNAQKRELFRPKQSQNRSEMDVSQMFGGMNREPFDPEKEAAAMDPQKLEKIRQKEAKIDAKIQKKIDKSNKKLSKKLSDGQYQVFLAKRGDFKYSVQRVPPMRSAGQGGRGASEGGMGSSMGPPEGF